MLVHVVFVCALHGVCMRVKCCLRVGACGGMVLHVVACCWHCVACCCRLLHVFARVCMLLHVVA